MIKLQRGEKPEYLTDEKVIQLTEEYKKTGKSVWNKDLIKKPLSASSFHKCAYCESDLTDPSTYMEVEHFLPKSKHPDLVVKWENLLPSCKRCNGTKNDDDVLTNPIVNPFENDPRQDFTFDNFFIFGKTELGVNTESTLDLNEESLFLKRCKVAGAVKSNLKQMHKDFESLSKLDKYKRNRFKSVLLAAQPNRPYSAFVATILHSMMEYTEIKQRFKSDGLWTDELNSLDEVSFSNVLSTT